MAQCAVSRIQPFTKLKGKGREQRVDTVTGNRGKFEQGRSPSEDLAQLSGGRAVKWMRVGSGYGCYWEKEQARTSTFGFHCFPLKVTKKWYQEQDLSLITETGAEANIQTRDQCRTGLSEKVT